MSAGAESHVPSSGGPPRYLNQNDSSPLLSLSESLPQSISGLCFKEEWFDQNILKRSQLVPKSTYQDVFRK